MMNVFMLNDGWADCGCGVPYTEGIFESPNRAMSYVLATDLKHHVEARERHIKHYGTSRVKLVDGWGEYPEFSAPAWHRTEDQETGMSTYRSTEGRWTIEEVVVQ